MSYIKNDHQLFTFAAVGATYYQRAYDLLDQYDALPQSPVGQVRLTRDWLWRMGPHVTDPTRVVRDFDHMEQILSGAEPVPPPLVAITEGDWRAQFLFGPVDSYFVPACINFDDDRFQRILKWNVDRGFTHLVINALEQDHWGASRGRPNITVRRHRWYDNQASRELCVRRLKETRAGGLQPIVGLYEHTSLPLDTQGALDRGRGAVDLTHEHTSAYIMCWETDERINDSERRMQFEEAILSGIDFRGRDVGIHYSEVKRLEGSGLDAAERWNRAYPGHVVKMYQSRRNAPIEEIREESAVLASVAKARGIKLAAFEHSGGDPAIGQVVTEQEANRRAQACYDEMIRVLPKERTGSMNGMVTA